MTDCETIGAAVCSIGGVAECATVPAPAGDGGAPATCYVVAGENAGGDVASDERAQKENWRRVYDNVYESIRGSGAEIDRKVWRSSLAGHAFDDDQLRSIFEARCAVLAKCRPQRVLDVGCGTAAFIDAVKDTCAYYCGTDFSESAIDAARKRVAAASRAESAFFVREAEDFDGLGSGYDMVLVNSVIQHLPSEAALRRLLTAAVAACADDGIVFVGDVRNSWLQAAYELEALRSRGTSFATQHELRNRLLTGVEREEEMLVAPQYFPLTLHGVSRVRGISARLVESPYLNELTQFRYDVTIEVGASGNPASGRGATIVEGIANARVAQWAEEARSLLRPKAPLPPPAIEWNAGKPEAASRTCWLRCDELGTFDAMTYRDGATVPTDDVLLGIDRIDASAPADLVRDPMIVANRRAIVRKAKAAARIAAPSLAVDVFAVDRIPRDGEDPAFAALRTMTKRSEAQVR
ncbi:MAG: class I SAM-dependent methyltransferase [Candidatus Eremiobacteraeota bacterium]|nr:class I SAM-dependent methyltransferase [Candidatus Eremiobacteraeota bacterium]